jgi:thioester reductase-like protein
MHVLLTGATGVLGAELLGRLLESQPGATMHVLLRAASSSDLEARALQIRSALHPRQALRVIPLAGDISQPDLGLGARYHTLAGSITEIFHAAASTRFSQSELEAERHNLSGTRNIVDFAQACRRAGNSGRLHYVSTAYVSGRRTGSVKEDELECGQEFFNAYERSKFEAERVIRAAGLPVTIYRPSVIVGHSLTGYCPRFAGIYQVLHWIHRGVIRTLPCSSDYLLDLTPVDYIAEAIVRLAASPTSAGKTFHLTAGLPNTIPVGEVIDLFLGERPRQAARLYPLRFELDSPDTRRLRPYVPYLTCPKSFDDSNTRSLLQDFQVPFCRDYFPQVARFAFQSSFRNGAYAAEPV